MSDSILIEEKGAVRVITLNRPKAFNSFDRAMGKAFQEALDSAGSDDSVRCIVVKGEGKAFCAGQDLKEVTAPDAPDFRIIVEDTYNASIRRICALRKPVIAAVNGVAAGAGANIAFACDLTIATQSASFIQAFSKIGLIPDSGGTYWLPRLVGMQRAKAMAFFGNKVSSSEAESIGLIYKCVADEAFESEVEKISSKLAAMPTLALGLTKVAFHEGLNNDLNAQLKTELDYQFIAAESNDYKEGVTSFLEKRVPVFKGN